MQAFAAQQKAIEVQSVRDSIKKENAGWVAKDTWLSRLPAEDLKRMMGLQVAPDANLDFEGVQTKDIGISNSIDWRNYNGENWLGPVMNQGNCGSCVAFASVATLEGQTSISAGIPWLRPSYSPQMLFGCGGGGCESGWMPDSAASFMKRTGITDEACMPYTSGSSGEDVDCSAQCSDSKARTTKISNYTTPTSYGGSVDVVKKALKHGPLITTLTVYADFVTYGGGVYKHVTGSTLGGHAVSLVGFDNAKRAWLIRNSWGTEWGENGYGWISWDDRSGIGGSTWSMDLADSQGHLAVTAPADREYISGQYSVSAQIQGAKSGDIQFHMMSSVGKEVATFSCSNRAEGGCSTSIDTTRMKEGRYEIYAEGSGLSSQVREFFVLNSEPDMKLSFTPAQGTDLSQPQNGRPEFIITSSDRPVPLQRLEFRAFDSNGKQVASKSNDQVLPVTKMGWRTMTVNPGKYKILFHGETHYLGKLYTVDTPAVDVTVIK